MPIKTKFKEWLESDSYKHFVFDEGQSTNTTFIKVAKNDDFDYLFSQTFYSGSHIQRDDHLYFSGMYCKRDGQVYCAYSQLRRLIPEFEESKGQYGMAEEVQKKASQRINTIVLNNPDTYSTLRPISEEAEKKLSNYTERVVESSATEHFFAGIYADSLEYETEYQFAGWNEENLLEYIISPEQFIKDEAQRYLENHLEDILLDLRRLESLKEHLSAIENAKDSPLHKVKAISKAVTESGAQTARVTIVKNGIEFSFKTATDSLKRNQTSYSRWDISAAERDEYEKLFKFDCYRPEEIKEIKYRGQPIYSAEIDEPVQTEGLNQTM